MENINITTQIIQNRRIQMADFNAEGNKIVRCCMGHQNTMSFQTTFFKCSTCGCYTMISFFGVLTDKDGNYIY